MPVHVLVNNAALAHFHQARHGNDRRRIRQRPFRKPARRVPVRAGLHQGQRGAGLRAHHQYRLHRWNQNEAGWEAYGASKGGLVSLTNTLAVSLSATPITVNAVSPGWIQVDGYETLSYADHAQHPSGRVGIPRDIVNACLFLAHEENDFVNGHNLVVDGGMTKRMIYVE